MTQFLEFFDMRLTWNDNWGLYYNGFYLFDSGFQR